MLIIKSPIPIFIFYIIIYIWSDFYINNDIINLRTVHNESNCKIQSYNIYNISNYHYIIINIEDLYQNYTIPIIIQNTDTKYIQILLKMLYPINSSIACDLIYQNHTLIYDNFDSFYNICEYLFYIEIILLIMFFSGILIT